MTLRNPFDAPGRWVKANLHTHTTSSDGDKPLAQRVGQYREAGYGVLAITDHDVAADAAGLSDEHLLIVNGIETHPDAPPPGTCYHLVCLNTPPGLEFGPDEDAQTRIDKARAAGAEVVYAHPYWCGHHVGYLTGLSGYIGIEVFNATCRHIGKAYSSVPWDDLLMAGRLLPAVAVDDTHGDRDFHQGWTWLRLERLSAEAVLDSLRTGCFYGSCGPVIEDFRVANGRATVHCSPVREIRLMVNACGGHARRAAGDELTYAEMPLAVEHRYIRAEVVDAAGRHAWSNPIALR